MCDKHRDCPGKFYEDEHESVCSTDSNSFVDFPENFWETSSSSVTSRGHHSTSSGEDLGGGGSAFDLMRTPIRSLPPQSSHPPPATHALHKVHRRDNEDNEIYHLEDNHHWQQVQDDNHSDNDHHQQADLNARDHNYKNVLDQQSENQSNQDSTQSSYEMKYQHYERLRKIRNASFIVVADNNDNNNNNVGCTNGYVDKSRRRTCQVRMFN